MKFLVIILCLLSERFLIHVSSHHRFNWFMDYSNAVASRLSGFSPWIVLTAIIFPLVFIVWIVLHLFESVFFGLAGFILSLVIFYYCLGPANPFYPIRENPEEELDNEAVGAYLAQANEQLFAVLFWYIVLGPVSIVLYRLLSLCQGQPAGSPIARQLLDIFDYLPARLTALLYLFAGNFQPGFTYFCKSFFALPSNNQKLVRDCGLAAIGKEVPKTMLNVEQLVEHVTVILLVFLALFTMVSWM